MAAIADIAINEDTSRTVRCCSTASCFIAVQRWPRLSRVGRFLAGSWRDRAAGWPIPARSVATSSGGVLIVDASRPADRSRPSSIWSTVAKSVSRSSRPSSFKLLVISSISNARPRRRPRAPPVPTPATREMPECRPARCRCQPFAGAGSVRRAALTRKHTFHLAHLLDQETERCLHQVLIELAVAHGSRDRDGADFTKQTAGERRRRSQRPLRERKQVGSK